LFDFGTKHKLKMLFWALSSVTVYKQNPCFTGWCSSLLQVCTIWEIPNTQSRK